MRNNFFLLVECFVLCDLDYEISCNFQISVSNFFLPNYLLCSVICIKNFRDESQQATHLDLGQLLVCHRIVGRLSD